MLELDFRCHEICLNQTVEWGRVDGMELASTLNAKHRDEVEELIIPYVWGFEVTAGAEGEAGTLIDNYFEEGKDARGVLHTTSLSTLSSGPSKEEKKGENEDEEPAVVEDMKPKKVRGREERSDELRGRLY